MSYRGVVQKFRTAKSDSFAFKAGEILFTLPLQPEAITHHVWPAGQAYADSAAAPSPNYWYILARLQFMVSGNVRLELPVSEFYGPGVFSIVGDEPVFLASLTGSNQPGLIFYGGGSGIALNQANLACFRVTGHYDQVQYVLDKFTMSGVSSGVVFFVFGCRVLSLPV